MKRDLDLVKEVLTFIENQNEKVNSWEIVFEDHNSKQVAYHLELLLEAGYLKGKEVVPKESGVRSWVQLSLRWKGHEFLDVLKNETSWKKIKGKMEEQGQELPFSVIKAIGIAALKSAFGL